MRILFIVPRAQLTLSEPVGDVIRVRELIRGFEKNDDKVFTICAGDKRSSQKATQIYRKAVKKMLPVQVSGVMHDIYKIAHDLVFQREVQRIVAKLLPLDLIIEQYTFFCRTGVSVARKFNIPIVLDDISPIWEDEQYYRRDLKNVARYIQKRVFLEADGLVAVSEVTRKYLPSCGVPYEKIFLVPNGADCGRFYPGTGSDRIRNIYNIQNKVVIGFVGSFGPWHETNLLISCLRDFLMNEEVHLLLVGDGSNRKELEQNVRNSNIEDKVTFTGKIPFEQVSSYIDAMDITVIPNSANYQSPIKIFEYMAMGKVVVAPRLTNIKEIVTDTVDGFLFSPKDPEDLSRVIRSLIYDEKRRQEIGYVARQKILKHFTWEISAQKIREIINRPQE